jgi:antitoxin ParD1/3/4
MTTMNISLPEGLKAFVDEQVAARGYGSASEYVRDLIRRDEDVQKFRALIQEGIDSAPGTVADAAFFEDLRARIRAARPE